MDEEKTRIWYEAMERHDFHFTGDMAAGFSQVRVYGDTPSFLGVPVAWEAEELEGADVAFVGNKVPLGHNTLSRFSSCLRANPHFQRDRSGYVQHVRIRLHGDE